ncbi:MAG: hypothetical protein RSB67_00505 [Clostridia bacterium]
MNIIVSKIPIISNNQKVYNGCCNRGKTFYFTQDKLNEIHVFGENCCYESKIETNDTYYGIACNSNDSSLYLSRDDNSIIKLDLLSKETVEINIEREAIGKEKIKSISYCLKENILYIVNEKEITSIEIGKNEINLLSKQILNENEKEIKFSSIYNDDENIYIGYTIKNQAYLAKLDEKYKIKEEYYIDDNCTINNIFTQNRSN